MRVAIADDHAVVRDGLRWLLSERDDVEVVGEAGTSDEALAILEEAEPPDVMLLDLRMGGTSGFEVLEGMGTRTPATRIVVLTMHDEPALVRRALALGASAYVLKNGGRTEIMRALDTAHSGGRYVQSDLAASVADSSGNGRTITPRERDILQCVARGMENRQVARTLGISEETVKSYLRNLFARWHVTSRAEAVAIAIRLGVID